MFTPEETTVIEHAAEIFKSKIKTCDAFTNPGLASGFCQTRLAHLEREVFMVLHLDCKHRLIEAVELFAGSIDSASIHPREVVKSALHYNSFALIIAHNHPSGDIAPSASDRRITSRLRDALDMVDIRILDHIVVGCEGTYSFAEHGLI